MSYKKIKVLFLIDFLFSDDGLSGGTERQVIQIVKRLDRENFYPIVVCLKGRQNKGSVKNLNCEIHYKNVSSLLSINGLLSFASFVTYLKNHKIDIIQTIFFDSTLFGILAAKISGVENRISWRRDLGFWYNKKYLSILFILNWFTKRILVNSQSIKDVVINKEKFPKDRIDVLYNGIDCIDVFNQKKLPLKVISENIEYNDRIVGIVGNFNRHVKRLDLFIECAAIVGNQRNNVKFVIVGGGSLEIELKKLAHTLAISDLIIFSGKQDNAIPYIKNFDVGVLTSDSEGFSNALLEYMACGIAPVATDVGGNRELIKTGKTGILVPRGESKALASAIIDLLDDDQYRERLGQQAKKLVERKYSWEKKIKEIESYYKPLVKN